MHTAPSVRTPRRAARSSTPRAKARRQQPHAADSPTAAADPRPAASRLRAPDRVSPRHTCPPSIPARPYRPLARTARAPTARAPTARAPTASLPTDAARPPAARPTPRLPAHGSPVERADAPTRPRRSASGGSPGRHVAHPNLIIRHVRGERGGLPDREPAQPDALRGTLAPRPRSGGGGRTRRRTRADERLRVRQRRDLRSLLRIGPRLRRLRPAVPFGAGQHLADGATDHGGRPEAGERQADHGGRAVLPLRPPGQEAPRPRADLRPARRRPVQDRRCAPAHVGRPAHRADPGLLRRPGGPPVRAAAARRLHREQAGHLGSHRRRPRLGPGTGGRALDRPAGLPAGHHPQAAGPRRAQPGEDVRRGR